MAAPTPEQFNKVVAKVQERGVSETCPRCNTDTWKVELMTLNVSQPVTPLALATQASVPVAVVICANCGFLSFHSLRVLGLEP